MIPIADKLQILLSQYGLIKRVAENSNGHDLYQVATLSRRHWAAAYPNLSTIKRNAGFGIRCDGKGLGWGADVQMWPGGPNFQCLDQMSNVTKARPCEACGRPVCNVCRFHLDRKLDLLWGDDPDWHFDDEERLRENPRSEWRNAGYKRIHPSRASYLAWPPSADRKRKSEHVLADSWRIYCPKHVKTHKQDLLRLLSPGKLPGPLCTCNPLDRFVGRWLCKEYFDDEVRNVPRHRSRTTCCEPRCGRPADRTWKQCCLCKRSKEPYAAKGHNALHRRDDER